MPGLSGAEHHHTAPPRPAGFFKYIKWALHDFTNAPLHTNNQLLSLTDQLNLGVRSVELDTHWVSGCGGTAAAAAACGAPPPRPVPKFGSQ